MQTVTTDNLDDLIQKRVSAVRNIDDYVMIRILLACRQERDKGWYEPLLHGEGTDEDQLYRIFMQIKLLLRRIEFGFDEDETKEVISFLADNHISPYLVYDMIHVNFVDEIGMQQRFSNALMGFCEDDEYRQKFADHARLVELYDIDL